MTIFLMGGLLGGWGAVLYGIFKAYKAMHQRRRGRHRPETRPEPVAPALVLKPEPAEPVAEISKPETGTEPAEPPTEKAGEPEGKEEKAA